jgi:hypothetical protein
MGVGAVGVMSRRLMVTGGVVPGSFLVMLRRMLMVLGGLDMMGMGRMGLRCFLGHWYSPFKATLIFVSGQLKAAILCTPAIK